jgi:hypothetical protein
LPCRRREAVQKQCRREEEYLDREEENLDRVSKKKQRMKF